MVAFLPDHAQVGDGHPKDIRYFTPVEIPKTIIRRRQANEIELPKGDGHDSPRNGLPLFKTAVSLKELIKTFKFGMEPFLTHLFGECVKQPEIDSAMPELCKTWFPVLPVNETVFEQSVHPVIMISIRMCNAGEIELPNALKRSP